MLLPLLLIFLSPLFVLTFAQSTPDVARVCSPGKYDTGIECEYCTPGTFSLSEYSFTCGDCPRGHGVPLSDPICRTCEPGTYSLQPGTEPCNNCFPGFYSDEPGAVECKKCPDGSFSSGAGAHSLESCVVCPPGSRWAFIDNNVADCIPCEPGTTSIEPNSETCTACPPGTFQPFGDSYEELKPRFCRPCPPGSFSDKNGTVGCTPCAEGTYQHDVGATSCKECPSGSESDTLGSTQCRSTCDTEDDSCFSCPAGWGLDVETGNCTQCATGTVNSHQVVTECVECDSTGGQVSDEERAECKCDLGLLVVPGENGQLTCERCPDGASSPDGTKCLCNGGRYMHPAGFCDCEPGTKLVSGGCMYCEEDELLAAQDGDEWYSDEEEEGNENEEDYEDDGLYVEGVKVNQCVLCGPGHGLSSSGVCCVPCANGTANEVVNLRVCSACPGEQIPNEDGTECACPPGTERTATGCAKCPAGTFGDGPLAVCTECWPGTFSSEGSAECTPCPAETESMSGASECVPVCPALSERIDDGSCRCAENAIQTGSDPLKCELCPGIQLADEGRTVCLCSPGYGLGEDGVCRFCAPGSFSAGGDKPCSLCEIGTASDIEGQAYSCQPCEPGKDEAMREGLTKCEPLCEKGSFRKSDGQCAKCAEGERVVDRSCVPCVDGSVSGGGAQAFCESCAEGLVPDARKVQCVRPDGKAPCPPGTWVDGSECTPCGAGTFSDVPDAVQCTQCPKGTFREEEGAKICEVCLKGFVAATEGSAGCTPCPDGTFQEREGEAICGRCAEGKRPSGDRTACE